jgi:hypothetical protein
MCRQFQFWIKKCIFCQIYDHNCAYLVDDKSILSNKIYILGEIKLKHEKYDFTYDLDIEKLNADLHQKLKKGK